MSFFVANDIPAARPTRYDIRIVAKGRRVIVCGNSVALAGITTSLGLEVGCDVVAQTLPMGAGDLCKLHPRVVIFELGAVSHDWIYTLSSAIPGLLLIGIDPETNRALLLQTRQAVDLSSRDLAEIIRQVEPTLPAPGKKPGHGA